MRKKSNIKKPLWSPHWRNLNFCDEFIACVTAKSRRAKVQACLLIYQCHRSTFLHDKDNSPAANKVIKSQIVAVWRR